MGRVSWISLVVTVAGFAFAWWQLIKVAGSTKAAKDAIVKTSSEVRSHEQSNKISSSLSYLKSAIEQINRNNHDACLAYMTIGWEVLVEAKELTMDQHEKDEMINHLASLRRIIEDIGRPGAGDPSITILQERFTNVSAVVDALGNIAARARFSLAGIGA